MTKKQDGKRYNAKEIRKHYHHPKTREIIKIFAEHDGAVKAIKHDDKGLYKYRKDKRRLINPKDDKDYDYITKNVKRVLLTTLNHFQPAVFKDWQPRDAESPGTFQETKYLMLSVDIDLADKHTVHDKKALAALETAGKYLHQILSNLTNGNILALFSGNGIYIHLHPLFAHLPDDYKGNEREQLYDILTKAFNLYLQELESDLYLEHPEVHGLIKIDAINNRKRYFKTVLSLHKRLPYVVYPIDNDAFGIPLKTIPLSSEDLQAAEDRIHSFMAAGLTREPMQKLKEALIKYEDDIKVKKQEYQELNIDIPDAAISIDIIKSEPVTAAIFHPDGWLKGNTRRVAYMASVLHLCGWDDNSIHEYIEGIAKDWNVGALSHVIDSWIGMHPPNMDTIYNKGSNYPMMNMGDCLQYLPDKPDYQSPLYEIFKKAGIKNQADEPTPEPGVDIKLEYPTEHLSGYNDLKTATDLFGDHYRPIFKALWYQMMGYMIRSANIHAGRIKTDGRISALYPIKAGHGKGELKRTIQSFVKYFDGLYGEPTSLHAEQLVGKTSKKPKTDEYIQRHGYLADDWLVIDEAFNLLSSNELHYSEARKYIRTALDRYPGNTITKRTTEYGRDAPLEYDPICPITLFLQPKVFENDILVLEGDIRRVICPYVNMTGIDKFDAYKQNIFDESDNKVFLKKFCTYIEGLQVFDEFKITTDSKVEFLKLFKDFMDYGLNYNEKIRNFSDINDFTVQIQFLKFAAIQAFQHGRNTIQIEDVQLAYIDLFEIMNHTFQYVNAKIPGYLNYGEGWKGAELKDQEIITWMHQQNAINEGSAITNDLYLDQVMDVYGVKERQAKEIKSKHIDKGWIENKRLHRGAIVWLKFIPENLKGIKCKMQSGYNVEGASDEYSIQYYLLLNNYYNILKRVHAGNEIKDSNPTASCTLCTPENNTTPQPLDNIKNEPESINHTTKTISTLPEDVMFCVVQIMNMHRDGIIKYEFRDMLMEMLEAEDTHLMTQYEATLIDEGHLIFQDPDLIPTDKMLAVMDDIFTKDPTSTTTDVHHDTSTPNTTTIPPKAKATASASASAYSEDGDMSNFGPLQVKHKPNTSTRKTSVQVAWDALRLDQAHGLPLKDFTRYVYDNMKLEMWEDAEAVRDKLIRNGWIYQPRGTDMIKPSDQIIDRAENSTDFKKLT